MKDQAGDGEAGKDRAPGGIDLRHGREGDIVESDSLCRWIGRRGSTTAAGKGEGLDGFAPKLIVRFPVADVAQVSTGLRPPSMMLRTARIWLPLLDANCAVFPEIETAISFPAFDGSMS